MPDYLSFAEELARQAGAVLRQGYGRQFAVEHKGVRDLVTEYDRRSEALILGRIHDAFPDHAVLAEESGHVDAPEGGQGEYEWVVDPLDGTTNFAHGFPLFCVTLALTLRGRIIAGVIYDPLRDDMYSAAAGQGATLNGAPLRVSAVSDIGQALLVTGFPYDLRTNPHNNFAEFERFSVLSQAVRRPGSAALDCAWVAAGRADGYWEYRMKAWDVAAGILLTREAGGRATTATGEEDCLGQESILLTNGLLHDNMMMVLAEERPGSEAGASQPNAA
jgi:myo-inositol-1(or 4)-monophosphatase